ncbi:MAG TPA: hypothetical protein VK616_12290 [Flavitalea sp.]|nr:hypothetical protein [Flavitalea sp.]
MNATDILEDIPDLKRKWINRKAVYFLIIYIPGCLLLFYLSSPLFLSLWNNESEVFSAVGPVLLVCILLLFALGLAALKLLKALNGKTLALLTLETIVVTAGILFLMLHFTIPEIIYEDMNLPR